MSKRLLGVGLTALVLGVGSAIYLDRNAKELFYTPPKEVEQEVLGWEGRTNVERGLPGVCISFDDYRVNDWFKYLRPLEEKYGAKFTLFVSAPLNPHGHLL